MFGNFDFFVTEVAQGPDHFSTILTVTSPFGQGTKKLILETINEENSTIKSFLIALSRTYIRNQW